MKNTILRECLRIARSKNTPELHPEFYHFPHYSFIVEANKIVAWGTNRHSGTLNPHWGYTTKHKTHAETAAYQKAKGILSHSKTFECVNIRLNKLGELRLSKPCMCCHNFLSSLGCKIVYFSTEQGFAKLKIE
jgi:tRNA(Arg) A34 adenosine deaminase TadA